MKFDIVIGNPPYQKVTQSIYQDFVLCGKMVANSDVIMITRNNWMVSIALEEFKREIEGSLVGVVNYPITGEIFPTVRVQVSIIHLNLKESKEHSTKLIEIRDGRVVNNWGVYLGQSISPILTTDPLEHTIIYKVYRDIHSGKVCSFEHNVMHPGYFGINTNGNTYGGSNSKALDIREEQTDEFSVAVAFRENNKLKYRYIRKSDIDAQSEIDKYKVVIGEKADRNDKVIYSVNIIEPGSVFTASYAGVYSTEDKDKAYLASKYIKTKFFRYMLRCLCSTGLNGVSAYRFKLIPDFNFDITDGIDWSLGVGSIDKQLYIKYNLNELEIAQIEETLLGYN